MVRITHARRVGVVNTMNGRTNVTGGGSNGSLGGVIPLEAPSNFTVTPDNGKCLLTWTDPKDKYADEIGEITDEGDQLVSQFAHTRIVRKVGSAPSSPNDGDLVTDSSTRNQYQSSAYVDDGLTNNTLYYYAAFTCNTDGVYSGAAVGSGTPKSYDPILANNTWEQINDVANEGIASSVWEIGDLGPEITIPYSVIGTPYTATTNTKIVAFDTFNISDGSGKGAIVFMFDKYVNSGDYQSGGSFVEYWSDCGLADSCNESGEIFQALPEELRSCIHTIEKSEEVFKSYYSEHPDVGWNTRTFTSKLFSLTIQEIGLSYTASNSSGATFEYPGFGEECLPYFTTPSNIMRPTTDSNQSCGFILASGRVEDRYAPYAQTMSGGQVRIAYTNVVGFLNLGFCIGKTPA